MPALQDADPGATLSSRDKGVPTGIAEMPLNDVAAQGWNLLREDLPLPVAILKDGALRQNSAWMRRFIQESRVQLAPHGKTTMAPELFQLQLQDGAWGITLSTPHQFSTARALGHKRIFIANQIAGRAAIRDALRSIEEDAELDLYSLVDSIEHVAKINLIAEELGQTRPLKVLVEKGFLGGRTGCRSVADAVEVARAVAASRCLVLAGVEGFEGIIRRAEPMETLAALEQFLTEIVAVAEQCDREGLFTGPVLLSAGGSAFFDLVVKAFEQARLSVERTILLRSGCYITHDSVMYTHAFKYLEARAPELFVQGGLRPALEVWAYIQSRPESGRAIATIGKRDIGYDQMPVAESWYRPDGSMTAPQTLPTDHKVVRLDDQHGYIDLPPESPLQVGDMVSFGISHPCLTFDKWRVLHIVNQDYDVIKSIRTYF